MFGIYYKTNRKSSFSYAKMKLLLYIWRIIKSREVKYVAVKKQPTKARKTKKENSSLKSKTKAKNNPSNPPNPLKYEVIGLALIGFAIITFFEYGVVGRSIVTIAMFFLGNLDFFVPVLSVIIAAMLMVRRRGVAFSNRVVIGMCIIVVSLSIFSHSILFEQLHNSNMLLSDSVIRETWRILINAEGILNRSNALGGGMIGALLFSGLHLMFESTGAKVAAWILFAIGFVLVTGKAIVPWIIESAPKVKSKVGETSKKTRASRQEKRAQKERLKQEQYENQVDDEPTFQIEPTTPIISAFTEKNVESEELDTFNEEPNVVDVTSDAITMSDSRQDVTYILPPITLLQEPPAHDQSEEYSVIQSNAEKLEQTLLSFGVRAKVVQVHLGPAVTKYEIMPDTGVKVSKIVGLQDDLALALAAKDIRMEAPIPGRSAIGIEVPNSQIAVVSLREVLDSNAAKKSEAPLLVAFGRDVTGQAMLAQLNKMPHLLVAGSTGSGKSVCINGIIVSLLMRYKPHEVRLMMIDPKMVELTVYNGIPHLLAPVVTDPRKASQALQKIVAEMERRYDLFSHTGTRNIEGYNAHINQHNRENEEQQTKLPYIVVIVDELADLMMVAPGEVEDAITRLAQMARAAGIHLIIATQRPSVDVITGIIKANIPSRISFAVSSAVDSRTILDGGGAERLLGRGDMLYLPAGASKPTRVQGAFVSDEEVEAVVDFVIEQQKAQYEEAMIPTDEPVVAVDEEVDVLYDEAVQLVVELQSASVSMLQRKFRIGYGRAARIMDQMEARGVVGPPDGSRPRQVLL